MAEARRRGKSAQRRKTAAQQARRSFHVQFERRRKERAMQQEASRAARTFSAAPKTAQMAHARCGVASADDSAQPLYQHVEAKMSNHPRHARDTQRRT